MGGGLDLAIELGVENMPIIEIDAQLRKFLYTPGTRKNGVPSFHIYGALTFMIDSTMNLLLSITPQAI